MEKIECSEEHSIFVVYKNDFRDFNLHKTIISV